MINSFDFQIWYWFLWCFILLQEFDRINKEIWGRSEFRGLASCIYQFFNKYNWLCVFWGTLGKENPALRPGYVGIMRLFWCVLTSEPESRWWELSGSLHLCAEWTWFSLRFLGLFYGTSLVQIDYMKSWFTIKAIGLVEDRGFLSAYLLPHIYHSLISLQQAIVIQHTSILVWCS